MLKRIHKFQSMVEYSLLLAVLVIAFLYAANSVFKDKAKNMSESGVNIMANSADRIKDSIVE